MSNKLQTKYRVQYWKNTNRTAVPISKRFASFKEAKNYFQSLKQLDVYLDDLEKGTTIYCK